MSGAVDLLRELAKARDALIAAQKHPAAYSESMAALHCAPTVHYSPLHGVVTSALVGIDLALARGADVSEPDHVRLAALLADLDRCTHGRHSRHGRGSPDPCFDCPGGISNGNPVSPNTVIGYRVHGEPITIADLLDVPEGER